MTPRVVWLSAPSIVGCLFAFIVLVVSAFIALSVMGYTTPVMLGLIAGGLVTLINNSEVPQTARYATP